MRARWLGLASLWLAGTAAAAPQLDQPLPPVQVEDRGEARVSGDEVVFVPWTSDSLRGRWTLLQHLAARLGVDKLNRPAIDAVAAAVQNGGYRPYQLVNIINVDDVAFGATGFAVSAIQSNKKKHAAFPMIADRGLGAARWGLQPKTSAIFLLDEHNVVRFFREGALGPADVQRILELLALPADAAAGGR